MEIDWQLIGVAVILAGCVAWILIRFVRRHAGASDCAGCPLAGQCGSKGGAQRKRRCHSGGCGCH